LQCVEKSFFFFSFIYVVSYLFHSDTAEVKEKAVPAQVKKGIHALM